MNFTRGKGSYKSLNIGKDRIKKKDNPCLNVPITQRIMDRLVASDIVSVVPMKIPSGKISYGKI